MKQYPYAHLPKILEAFSRNVGLSIFMMVSVTSFVACGGNQPAGPQKNKSFSCSADCNGALTTMACAQLDSVLYSGGTATCTERCTVSFSSCILANPRAEYESCTGSDCVGGLTCRKVAQRGLICIDECDPAASDCVGGRKCEQIGTNQSDGACLEPVIVPNACETENVQRCLNNAVEVCTKNVWKMVDDCTKNNGDCMPEGTGFACVASTADPCVEGDTTRCDGNRVQNCVLSIWTTTDNCNDEGRKCVGTGPHECQAACVNGDTACDGNNVQLSCIAGLWQAANCVSPKSCQADGGGGFVCKEDALCTANATRCDANTLKTCNATGSAETDTPCNTNTCQSVTGGFSCVDTSVCTPGATACAGNILRVCNQAADGYDDSDCGTEICTATNAGFACVAPACTPGALSCSDNTLRECNSNGIGYIETPCGNDACIVSGDSFACVRKSCSYSNIADHVSVSSFDPGLLDAFRSYRVIISTPGQNEYISIDIPQDAADLTVPLDLSTQTDPTNCTVCVSAARAGINFFIKSGTLQFQKMPTARGETFQVSLTNAQFEQIGGGVLWCVDQTFAEGIADGYPCDTQGTYYLDCNSNIVCASDGRWTRSTCPAATPFARGSSPKGSATCVAGKPGCTSHCLNDPATTDPTFVFNIPNQYATFKYRNAERVAAWLADYMFLESVSATPRYLVLEDYYFPGDVERSPATLSGSNSDINDCDTCLFGRYDLNGEQRWFVGNAGSVVFEKRPQGSADSMGVALYDIEMRRTDISLQNDDASGEKWCIPFAYGAQISVNRFSCDKVDTDRLGLSAMVEGDKQCFRGQGVVICNGGELVFDERCAGGCSEGVCL